MQLIAYLQLIRPLVSTVLQVISSKRHVITPALAVAQQAAPVSVGAYMRRLPGVTGGLKVVHVSPHTRA